MKKEKLELKHIAPYLPYGLVVTNLNEKIELSVRNIDFMLLPSQDFKPMLKPLSDLTEKEANFMWFEIISTDNDCFNQDDFYESVVLGSVQFLPIMVYEYLLSKHFDVFGLIDKGLAININTLNNKQ